MTGAIGATKEEVTVFVDMWHMMGMELQTCHLNMQSATLLAATYYSALIFSVVKHRLKANCQGCSSFHACTLPVASDQPR